MSNRLRTLYPSVKRQDGELDSKSRPNLNAMVRPRRCLSISIMPRRGRTVSRTSELFWTGFLRSLTSTLRESLYGVGHTVATCAWLASCTFLTALCAASTMSASPILSRSWRILQVESITVHYLLPALLYLRFSFCLMVCMFPYMQSDVGDIVGLEPHRKSVDFVNHD